MQCHRTREVSRKVRRGQAPQTASTGLKLTILAAVLAASFLIACSSGGGTSPGPQPGASEWFFVDNFSGDVSGFGASSGKLAPIAGSSVLFQPVVTQFAVEPSGAFLAAVSTTSQSVSTLEIATIGSGGAMTLARLTNVVTTPGGLAISSKGVLAVTDMNNATVQLMALGNGLFFEGASAATGAIPRDVTFSPDGKTLYVGNEGDGTISVFSVSSLAGALQLVETAHLPVSLGEFTPAVVRMCLNAAGTKLAATSADGRLFVGDVRTADGALSAITETLAAAGANLEEVIFDPTGQNIYTADQDHGGIYGFSVQGTSLTPLPGSPVSSPLGPTSLAADSAGAHVYVVLGPESQIITFARDLTTGQLTATGESVNTGGLLAQRMVRVPAH